MINLSEFLQTEEKETIEGLVDAYLNASEEAKPLIIANMQGMISTYKTMKMLKQTA